MRVFVIGLAILATQGAQADGLSGRLRFQLGQEYDTNAKRIYSLADTPTPSDFLTRLIVQGNLAWAMAEHRFAVDYQAGAKLFYQQTDEHQVANNLAASYSNRVKKRALTGLRLALRDVTQSRHSRDYLLLNAELFLRLRPHAAIALEAWTGGRHFSFKPDDELIITKFSHLGPTLGLRLQATLAQDWTAWFSYGLDVRFFEESEILRLTAGDARQDNRHKLGLKLRFQTHWLGRLRLITQASYHLVRNDSNSNGSSMIWHRLQAVLSIQLPMDLSLHLMGRLQFTDYLDGLNLDLNLYEPEADENENTFVARLAYRLWDELRLVGEVAIYRNAFDLGESGALPFARETFMLGLSWGWAF
jgi:hypothetical protein